MERNVQKHSSDRIARNCGNPKVNVFVFNSMTFLKWIKMIELRFKFQLIYNYASYIMNGLPKYFNDVLHIPIERNSIYNSVSRIMNIFVAIFTGFMCDWMHVKHKIALTTIRKTCVALCKASDQFNVVHFISMIIVITFQPH